MLFDRNEPALAFDPLRRALAQLESALQYSESAAAKSDPELYRHLRAGAIQAFEYTYELSITTLKRFLMLLHSNADEVKRLSFNDLLRLGYDYGVVQDELAVWAGFREDRNRTSHTYSEQMAATLYKKLPAFLACVRVLVGTLEQYPSQHREHR